MDDEYSECLLLLHRHLLLQQRINVFISLLTFLGLSFDIMNPIYVYFNHMLKFLKSWLENGAHPMVVSKQGDLFDHLIICDYGFDKDGIVCHVPNPRLWNKVITTTTYFRELPPQACKAFQHDIKDIIVEIT